MIVANFVHPVLLTIGPLTIYSYGAMIALGLAACTLVVSRDINRLGLPMDASTAMIFFIPGFGIGSKAQLFLSFMAGVGDNANMGLEAGHSFMGSAIGGVFTSSIYSCWCGCTVLEALDLVTPLVPLGHAIGKWGCFLSGDGCYGPPADPGLPWAMSFPNGGSPTNEFSHPTPLYESFLSGSVFLFIYLFFAIPAMGENRVLAKGRRSAIALALYGSERIFIEPFRRHPAIAFFGGLTEHQFLAVIFCFLSIGMTITCRGVAPWPRPRMVAPEAANEGDGPAKAGDKAGKKEKAGKTVKAE